MTLDPHFKAMLDAQAAAAAAAPPPLSQIPPAMVRAGYRAQRTSQNVNTSPASVTARDLEIPGPGGPVPARLYTPEGAATPLMLLKRKVKKFIDDEDPRKPLTDDLIVSMLDSQGIQVTRRTVAKYREDLRIPSTHQRRVRD